MSKQYKTALTSKQLAKLSDDQIDTSDIPELDETFWQNATINAPRSKPTVSLRLPEEVIKYFKAENPKGYTGRMAAVLSAYVSAQQKHNS